MQHEILPLNVETILTLKMKHPQAVNLELEVLFPDCATNIHPIRFESITGEEVWKVAMRTKGCSGPSGLDADGWRKILTSTTYGESVSNVSQAVARFIRKICTRKLY